jgi:hypothetical protein
MMVLPRPRLFWLERRRRISTDDSDLPLTMGHLKAFAQGLTRRLKAESAKVNAQAEENRVRAELIATTDDMRGEQMQKLRGEDCPESLVHLFEVMSQQQASAEIERSLQHIILNMAKTDPDRQHEVEFWERRAEAPRR